MLTTYNNEQLFLRDIKRNLPQGDTHAKNNEKTLGKLLVSLGETLLKVAIVNIQLRRALNLVGMQIKSDYHVFLKSDHHGKEDILIKWEKLGTVLNSHMTTRQDSSFLSIGMVRKTTKIVGIVSDFIKKLETELYPASNQNYSQEYLKKLSKKFEHFPKDVMDDLTSEQNLECV